MSGKRTDGKIHPLVSFSAFLGVYDDAGKVIDTQQHKGEFKEW